MERVRIYASLVLLLLGDYLGVSQPSPALQLAVSGAWEKAPLNQTSSSIGGSPQARPDIHKFSKSDDLDTN